MTYLGSDDSRRRTAGVEIDVEYWEGRDHHQAGNTQIDQDDVTRSSQCSISATFSYKRTCLTEHT